MTRAKQLLLGLAAPAVGLLVACGAGDLGNALDVGGNFNPSGADAAGAADKGGFPSATAPAQGPTANGVVLVHGASFPSFRLCFENFPEMLPQPDNTVMPEANVVGVEIGSLVRINPLTKAPGKVYVISESAVRSPAADTGAPKCGELLGATGSTQNTLTPDNEYHVINTPIDQPLGEGKVAVVAITGCGSQAFLNKLDNTAVDVAHTQCGNDWDTSLGAVHGNLKAQVIQLDTSLQKANDTSLPVQLFHMSPPLDLLKGASGTLTVTFDALSPATAHSPQALPIGALYAGGAPATVMFDQTDVKVYGTFGFKIQVQGASGSFEEPQSLATIQELSSSRDLPTTYYHAASNYALLLLGDPNHAPTLDGGAPNAAYNPRRAVHLLAIPVIDPATLDAGADASPTASNRDGG